MSALNASAGHTRPVYEDINKESSLKLLGAAAYEIQAQVYPPILSLGSLSDRV